MKLRHDDALSSVDDEGAIVGHQRNFAEEDFFFLNVANRFDVCIRVFVVNRQPNLDFQRHAVAHAAFLTFLLIVFVLKANRLAAIWAKLRPHRVESTANVTERFTRTQRIDFDTGAAVLARGAQILQPFEVAAFALPIADMVFDKVERCRLAKIRDRKHRLKDCLQPDAPALFRERIHLQESVI